MSPSPSPASPSPSNGKAVTIDDTTLSVNTEVVNLTAADPGGSGRSGSIGSGSTVACYATYNSPRDPLHMELEVWYATDTLSTGEVIRSVPVRTHSIDIKRGLLVGDVGHRDGTGKNGCVVPIGRSRKIPKKRQPVANYIEQHSWVEVWTMLPGGNELSNSQGRKHLGMHAWYLAEVIGFKGKDKLIVKYFFDAEEEFVPKSICRVVNPNGGYKSAADILRDLPHLEQIEEKDIVENWIADADETPRLPWTPRKIDTERKQPPPVTPPVTPVTPVASRRFSTPKRQRKSESGNNVAFLHSGGLFAEYCKERDALDAQIKATQFERLKKEEERGRAAKELEDITEQCKMFSIAETQSMALRQELERLHEQALNLAAAHRREAMGGRAESCARCRKPIEGAAEDALLVLQCHNGHPTCPDCRMAQDGLGRLVVANCSVCGGGVVFRYRAKPFLAPLMLPPVYVSQQPSPMPVMYVPPNQQLQMPPQWQWPPPPQQQQLIYPPSAVPPAFQQTLMVPIQDANSGGGQMACAYLGHDAAAIQ